MAIQDNPEFLTAIARLREDLVDLIEPGVTPFAEDDVEACAGLLQAFLVELDRTRGREASMALVKRTVLALNTLNAKCAHHLIEGDERRVIAGVIRDAGHRKGVNRMDEDVTEDWREW